MKLFKIFLSFFVIVALVFVVSLFFPHHYKIEKSVTINKPIYQSFSFMNDIKNWEKWSPWNKDIDSSMKFFYSKNTVGKDAKFYFRGNLVGIGYLSISESVPNEMIQTFLNINEQELTSHATFRFTDLGNKTQLSWIDEGDVGYNPILRFMVPSKIENTELAFSEGLMKIKIAIERY